MMHTCSACGFGTLRPLLRRPGVPVHQNRLCATRAEALGVARGDLDLVYCPRCALVFNRAFRAELLAYAAGYDNDQTASALFSRHVEERVDTLLRDGVRGRSVIEIGCGRGDFLRRLCRTGNNRGLGFDPVAPAGRFADGAGVQVESRRFEEESSRHPADVVVSRHVIEHVAEPVALLTLMRTALASHPDARLYLETPALEWILERAVIWDLFYEHASYFTEASLQNALAMGGFLLISQERVFGDQYLWATAAPAVASREVQSPSESDLSRLDAFAAREAGEVQYWRGRVETWASEGSVAVWGAGAKGATFLHLMDPTHARVEVVVDVNPQKQGWYVAGTGHPVVAPESTMLRTIRSIVVMNPNYRREVEQRIGDLGLTARVYVAER